MRITIVFALALMVALLPSSPTVHRSVQMQARSCTAPVLFVFDLISTSSVWMELFRLLCGGYLEFQRWENSVESLALHLCSPVPRVLAEALLSVPHSILSYQIPSVLGFTRLHHW